MKKKKSMIIVLTLVALLLVLGTSYALWQIVLKQTGTNVITTGCFQLSLVDESSAITLNEAFPITDEEGHKLDSYNFTVTNTCSTKANYIINLETLSNSDKNMPEKFLKTSLISDSEEIFLNDLITRFENLEKGIEESSKAFKLYEGSLDGNSSKTFDLRLWLDENTPLRDEVMNATYEGKIVVIASLDEPLNMNNMMISRFNLLEDGELDYENDNFEFFKDSHQIIFEEKINPIEGVEAVDLSKNETGSVVAYVDRSNPDNIVTHIQANGTILFPENCYNFLGTFDNLTAIIGLEKINTSYVTDMMQMFTGLKNITSLNLSGWDVSNVTNMENMFSDTAMINNLDLSNWKFSTNTVFDGIWHYINSLHEIETLNLSGWDVHNIDVKDLLINLLGNNFNGNLNLSNWYVNPEIISDIWNDIISHETIKDLDLSNWSFSTKFENASSVIPIHRVNNLNLSNWDISMITDTSNFFATLDEYDDLSDFPFLESLDLSGWDTSYVTNMSEMFRYLPELTTLNISSFDTTKVKDMSYMFSRCGSLTNITYGPKFIYDASKNIEGMFDSSPANKPTDSSWNGIF
ncbi:MAG: BspA family leucine-rich repeat surface protein [Bacilli bacterium]|nr:BspA family leucine-rich repeat surface protein [Bacilli bacterium]